MSGILAKLFNGSSSSSSTSAHSIPDVTSMESLCKAINDLTTESAEIVGQRAAEITRRNKDMFEKKTNDIEAFLLHCSPSVGSAAMVAAIKAMFDTSLAKNYEAGTDRAVELLKHYLDGGQLVGAHLRHVPEIVFPLVRSIGFYCLEKRNKPDIGEEIMITALTQLLPHMQGETQRKRLVTSWHTALFACALKTKNYEQAARFLDEYVDGLYNEHGGGESGAAAEEKEDGGSQAELKNPKEQQGSSNGGTKERETVKMAIAKASRHHAQSGGGAATQQQQQQPSHIDPKYVFQYLYFGALIHIELKQYRRALILLETCVAAPTFQTNDIQIDAYKKFLLVSLFVQGYPSDVTDRYPSVTRMAKSKMADYRQLMSIRFRRGKHTHGALENYMRTHKDKLERDGNWELMERIGGELRKKAVMAVAKIYSTVAIERIKILANLKSDEESMLTIEALVQEGRLTVTFDKEANAVRWEEKLEKIEQNEVEAAAKLIDTLNQMLEEKNKGLKPSYQLGKGSQKVAVFNEDEGLSMGMHPLET